MSGIIAYVSHWERRFSLSPAVEDEPMFRAMKPLYFIAGERSVLLGESSEHGLPPHTMDRDRNGGLGLEYMWTINPKPWARWIRHPVELIVADNGDLLVELPADHLLPWPKLNDRGVGDQKAIAVREFQLRATSAYEEAGKDGLKELLRTMPKGFKSYIPGLEWARVIEEVTTC